MTNQHDWLMLLTRVMSDPVVKTDIAYLVAQTTDNAQSVFSRGAELFQQRFVLELACQKGGDGFGYCGFDYCRSSLINLGVPRETIIGVNYSGEIGPINTLTEMISLVRFARQNKWQRICLVAAPFHQLRSFITAVTVVDRECPSLKIYNCVGSPLPWNQRAVHSQGVLTDFRASLITAEIERIERYQNDGKPFPLVSIRRALDYLDRRDRSQ